MLTKIFLQVKYEHPKLYVKPLLRVQGPLKGLGPWVVSSVKKKMSLLINFFDVFKF